MDSINDEVEDLLALFDLFDDDAMVCSSTDEKRERKFAKSGEQEGERTCALARPLVVPGSVRGVRER